jgi:radical SAM protein with 4Fe4S-binding SPASM domain
LTERSLPLDIAKAGIDYFFKENPSRHIRFYGPGEPTQEFGLMKQITAYAKSISDDVTVEIQTNGVFGNTVRDWVLENVNILWISFDGPPDIQNFNRPIAGKNPSALIIEANVRWLNENKSEPKLMVGARVTMTDKNINRQKEMVDYFYDLGIRHVWTNPLFPPVGEIPVCNDTGKLTEHSFDMNTYLDNYIEAYWFAKEKGMFYGSFLICNFDGEANVHCRACSPVPHLTPDGYVSACDMVVLGEKAYHMDCFIYGKWDSVSEEFRFDKEKINNLRNRNSDNMSHCKTCEARLHCGGYCLGEVVNETGMLAGQKPIACKAVRRLIKELGIFAEPFEYLHP